MLAKVTIFVSALLATAFAGQVSQCNGGNLQCCNTVGQSTDESVKEVAAGIGAVLDGINAVVGLGCSPITVIGLLNSGAKCTQQAVCCQGNNQNGLVNVGCTPVSIPV